MGRHNRIHAPAAGRPFPAGLDHRLAGTRVKDASGAAAAAGLRPVLDPGPPRARTGTSAEKGTTGPVQHALQTARSAKLQAETPLDTGPLLQG